MAGYKNFFNQFELAERKAQGRFLTEVNLLSPAQCGVQQYLYGTILVYCVEGRAELVPNSIFCLSVQLLQAGVVRGDPGGSEPGQVRPWAQVPAQNTSVPVVIPEVEEEKRTRVDECLAEQCKKKLWHLWKEFAKLRKLNFSV